jgi:hypothetical protein
MGDVDMLFIDANRYLDLYRMNSGKTLLATLEEQQKYIFVTMRIVNEVERNKVKVAADFLARRQLKLDSIAVPDHLLPAELLEQISRSEDEVSKRLAVIFSRAVPHNTEEFLRASNRKRIGSPPGKKSDALGDQISWEQILTKCKEERPKLWIITNDSDYATEHDGRMFLNAVLYKELYEVYGSAPEVFCFNSIDEGIRHFAATVKIKAEKLPTLEESKQIKKEQESLPPLGWLTNYDDSGFIAVQNAFRARDSELIRAALGSQFGSDETIFPIGPGDPDEKL